MMPLVTIRGFNILLDEENEMTIWIEKRSRELVYRATYQQMVDDGVLYDESKSREVEVSSKSEQAITEWICRLQAA